MGSGVGGYKKECFSVLSSNASTLPKRIQGHHEESSSPNEVYLRGANEKAKRSLADGRMFNSAVC